MELKQYEIILVNLNPTMGSEIKKTGPCIVISPNEMNTYLRTIIIAPMSTASKNYPTRIEIKHNDKIGWIAADQIRTIDKTRILKVLGRMTKPEIKQLKSVIKETFVDTYNLRELTLLPVKNIDIGEDIILGNIAFESIDTIVTNQLTTIESDHYDPNLLLDIYRHL